MKVLSFGEVLWDVYADSEHIGGAPLNFAAHFAKCGGESAVVTAVGKDELGDKTIRAIDKMGINTDYITYSDEETGKCLVTLDEKQIPSYNLLDNVAYDCIEKPDISKNTFDVLYFGTLSLRNKNNRDVLGKIISENEFDEICVDVNIRPPYYSDEVITFACENASIIKISDEELPVIMKTLNSENTTVSDCAVSICEMYDNIRVLIITRGDKGSYVYDCTNGKAYECGARKVEVVSTVGAGDSFSASFLSKYLQSGDIGKSLDLATKVSGYVVSQKGAIPEYNVADFE